MLNKIIDIVKNCSKIMLEADRNLAEVTEKEGRGNFVTKYDKAVQAELKKQLLALIPEAHFVGEEDDATDDIDKGYAFIVDPIDGTMNFVRDFHASVISVALTKDGEQYMGVVYNPYLDEAFSAERGKGAWLNGRPIHVSDRSIDEAIVLFGPAPYYTEMREESFRILRKYYDAGVDLRRSGSAATDLCSIACGRAEIYFELKLSPWDYAAGSLIVSEAGGHVSTIDGGDIDLCSPCSILAFGAGIDSDFAIRP